MQVINILDVDVGNAASWGLRIKLRLLYVIQLTLNDIDAAVHRLPSIER